MPRGRLQKKRTTTGKKRGRRPVTVSTHTRGKRGPGDSPRVKVRRYRRSEPRG